MAVVKERQFQVDGMTVIVQACDYETTKRAALEVVLYFGGHKPIESVSKRYAMSSIEVAIKSLDAMDQERAAKAVAQFSEELKFSRMLGHALSSAPTRPNHQDQFKEILSKRHYKG